MKKLSSIQTVLNISRKLWKLRTQRIFDVNVAKDLGKNNYLEKSNSVTECSEYFGILVIYFISYDLFCCGS